MPSVDSKDQSLDANTHFVFENKVFQVDGCFFSMTEGTREVIFNIPIGELTGSVRLNSLCSEFGIEKGSSDDRLLALVKAGIPYVRQIRPGDVIPSEVLDGSASWQIDPEHVALAMNRLSMRLVNWLVGSDMDTIDKSAVLAMAEDEEMKTRVNEGLDKAARQIKRKKAEVLTRFENLAKELAYIEALHDYYASIYKLFARLKAFQKIYADDQNFVQEIERMKQLMKPPVERIKETFDNLDLETMEVLPLIKSYEAKVELIRTSRDQLHLETTIWQELQLLWEGVPDARCDEAKIALQNTYKFLAKNFTVSHSW
jgi:hypothetical protein